MTTYTLNPPTGQTTGSVTFAVAGGTPTTYTISGGVITTTILTDAQVMALYCGCTGADAPTIAAIAGATVPPVATLPPGTIVGPAKIAGLTSSAFGVGTLVVGTLPAAAVDLGVSVTVLGNGNPVEITYGGLMSITGNGLSSGYVFLVDPAGGASTYMDEITNQNIFPSVNTIIISAVKPFWDTGLAKGAVRTYKLYGGYGNGATAATAFGRGANADFGIAARLG